MSEVPASASENPASTSAPEALPRAIEVAALLGDAVVGVRHLVRSPLGAARRTAALAVAGALLLAIAACAFAVGVRRAAGNRAAREAWIALDARPLWELRPARGGPIEDVAAVAGLLGGLACVGWALARHRDRSAPALTIGRGPVVDFATELGDQRFDLVAPRAAGFVLRVPPGAAIAPPPLDARQGDGALEVPLLLGSRYRVAAGPLAFVIAAAAEPPHRQPVSRSIEARLFGYAGASAIAHLALLGLLAALPPDAGALNDDGIGLDGRLASVRASSFEEKRPLTESGAPDPAGAMINAPAAAGADGAVAPARERRRAERGLRRPTGPATAVEATALARQGGILGLIASRPDALGDLGSLDDFAHGLDDRAGSGGPHTGDVGAQIGWGNGGHGFGADGRGDQGGGIAVGSYDRIAGDTGSGGPGGRGSCGRPGRPCGTLRSHRRFEIKPPRIMVGETVGGLDKETIRRFIRRHLAQLRHCYERALIGAPTLAGTTVVSFHISPQGTVQGAHASGLGAEVDTCVARVIATIEFPQPRGGGSVSVTSYPFTFVNPSAGAP